MTDRPLPIAFENREGLAMTQASTSKRHLLKLLACGLLTVPMASWPSRATTRPQRSNRLRRLGRRYLADTPHERDRATLLARLSLDCPFSAAGDRPPQDDFRRAVETDALKARREQEFASGETVVVDGWLLTRTEARLCALLTQPGWPENL